MGRKRKRNAKRKPGEEVRPDDGRQEPPPDTRNDPEDRNAFFTFSGRLADEDQTHTDIFADEGGPPREESPADIVLPDETPPPAPAADGAPTVLEETDSEDGFATDEDTHTGDEIVVGPVDGDAAEAPEPATETHGKFDLPDDPTHTDFLSLDDLRATPPDLEGGPVALDETATPFDPADATATDFLGETRDPPAPAPEPDPEPATETHGKFDLPDDPTHTDFLSLDDLRAAPPDIEGGPIALDETATPFADDAATATDFGGEERPPPAPAPDEPAPAAEEPVVVGEPHAPFDLPDDATRTDFVNLDDLRAAIEPVPDGPIALDETATPFEVTDGLTQTEFLGVERPRAPEPEPEPEAEPEPEDPITIDEAIVEPEPFAAADGATHTDFLSLDELRRRQEAARPPAPAPEPEAAAPAPPQNDETVDLTRTDFLGDLDAEPADETATRTPDADETASHVALDETIDLPAAAAAEDETEDLERWPDMDGATTEDLAPAPRADPDFADVPETIELPDDRTFAESPAPTESLSDAPQELPPTATRPGEELTLPPVAESEFRASPADSKSVPVSVPIPGYDADEAPEPIRTRPRRAYQKKKSTPLRARAAAVLGRVKARLAERGGFVKWARALPEAALKWWQTVRRPIQAIKADRNAAWWTRTLIEIGALFAIVIPIEIAVRGSIGAFGVHPHPYWLIVLPMAAARGVVAGLIAATVGSVLYAIGALLAVRPEDLGGLFEFSTMLEPILFFGVGFFTGELHDELALRYKKLARQLKELQERTQRLRQERDVLADANRELERRIVDHSVQFGNLIVAARRIEQSGRQEIFDLALEQVEEHCGAAASVLLVLENGSIDFLCHRGWSDEEIPERLAAARASPFVKKALDEGVNANGFTPGETPPEEGPLVVAPLFDASGVVKALLCLDDLPASRLNESTVTIFLGIGEWISASLTRQSAGKEEPAPAPSIPVMPTGDLRLGSTDDLGARLRLELERAARYGVPASFLAIQAPDWKDVSADGQAEVDRFMLTYFTGGMRPSDSLYRFGYPGSYLLVLAGTTLEGAEVVRTRLLRRIEYGNATQVGTVEIFATAPDAGAPDLLSLTERVAAQFRERTEIPLEGKCPIDVPREAKLGRIDQFIERIAVETSLATRNSFDLHVIGISAVDVASDTPLNLARHVREVGAKCLRPTDGVYAVGMAQAAIILPSTSGEESAKIAHRIVQAVRERDPDAPYGDLETQVLGLGPSHPDVHSFLEALSRRAQRSNKP